MSHTHFIVVSGKPSTDDLARVIVDDCTPSTGVLSSYGLLTHEGGGYEFHIGREKAQYESLQEGLKNHVAKFISAASISRDTAELNLFFLDNPYGENDYDQSAFLDLLKIKNDTRRGFDNLSVWHIVLAYDTKISDNVAATSEDDVLSHVFKSFRGSDGTYTCYIGTQNMTGGATFQNAEHHGFHLPRMLADFMLLASDPKTRAAVQQAAVPTKVGSKIFSFGHSEYMYYADEVKKLGRMYLDDALLNLRLTGVDNSDIQDPFDTNNNPLGLKKRAQELKSKYWTPNSYSLPIDNPENINVEIDNIIAESFGCYIGDEGYLGKTLVTRNDVHKASLKNDAANISQERKEEAENYFNHTKDCYESILKKITSTDFAEILKSEISKAENISASLAQERQQLEDEKNGRGLWRKLVEFFTGEGKRRQIKINSLDEEIDKKTQETERAEKARAAREQILALNRKKQQYADLQQEVANLENEKSENADNIKKFELRSYDDTKNLVNIDKLRSHFGCLKETNEKSILDLYEKTAQKKCLNSLRICFENYSSSVIRQYDHVNWDRPFDFIDFNIEDAYKIMGSKSLPYVHVSGAVGSMAYSANTQIFVSAKKEPYARIGVSSLSGNYQAMLSDTMEDKVCMLNVVSLPDEFVKVLLGETDEEVLEAEVISDDMCSTKVLGNKLLLPPTYGVNDQEDILGKIPPRRTQLGVGFRLIREIKFSEAKEFFAKTAHDSNMSEVCSFLIRKRRMIDTKANGAKGDMSDEEKREIPYICEVFARLGVEYDPLNIVIERYMH